jgi:hypothetical protein
MRKHFVGLGAHWTHTNLAILDARGKKVKDLTVRGAWSGRVEEIEMFNQQIRWVARRSTPLDPCSAKSSPATLRPSASPNATWPTH